MSRNTALWLFTLASMWGCGGSAFEGNEPATGGGAGAASGGAAGASTGGVSTSGGTVALGGNQSTGGQVQQGGAGSGGTASSGGKSNTGGSVGHGGAIATGGTIAIGGGGAGGTAGKLGSGGASAGSGGTGGIVDARCPARTPATGSTCSAAGLNCKYTFITDCLCTPQTLYSCPQVDPTCHSGSGGAGGFSAFDEAPPTGGSPAGIAAPIPPNRSCTCLNGSWSCVIGA